jgi:hypothetical protein
MGGWERGRDGCRGRPILMASLGRGRALHRIGPDGDSAAAPSLLTATALGHTARARHAASKAGPGRAGPGRPPRFVSFLFFSLPWKIDESRTLWMMLVCFVLAERSTSIPANFQSRAASIIHMLLICLRFVLGSPLNHRVDYVLAIDAGRHREAKSASPFPFLFRSGGLLLWCECATASGWLALPTAAAPLLSHSFYFVGQARDTCPPPPALRSRRFEVGGFEQKHGV